MARDRHGRSPRRPAPARLDDMARAMFPGDTLEQLRQSCYAMAVELNEVLLAAGGEVIVTAEHQARAPRLLSLTEPLSDGTVRVRIADEEESSRLRTPEAVAAGRATARRFAAGNN